MFYVYSIVLLQYPNSILPYPVLRLQYRTPTVPYRNPTVLTVMWLAHPINSIRLFLHMMSHYITISHTWIEFNNTEEYLEID